MFIRFPDEIKSRSIGNTPVNKGKCDPGSLRLKRWEGSHKMRRKADRCNPNVWRENTHPSSKQQEGGIQETVIQREQGRVDSTLDEFAICRGS